MMEQALYKACRGANRLAGAGSCSILHEHLLEASGGHTLEEKAFKLSRMIHVFPEEYIVEEAEWPVEHELGELRWWLTIGTALIECA